MGDAVTQYLIYADQPTCLARTHSEAVSRAAGGPDDVTQYWWAQIAHPTNGQWALAIPDSDAAGLPAGEQATLVSAATMQANGWFSATTP